MLGVMVLQQNYHEKLHWKITHGTNEEDKNSAFFVFLIDKKLIGFQASAKVMWRSPTIRKALKDLHFYTDRAWNLGTDHLCPYNHESGRILTKLTKVRKYADEFTTDRANNLRSKLPPVSGVFAFLSVFQRDPIPRDMKLTL
ncbi:hypothetical protein L596_026276 [Steinernema carpocapsae]|uniref:Uncharacterized protein n=1 Tax=Steinernema carpocapsae TaxID=34508 RepID=A0A4U5M0V7_STECR|nr:hypothetical protein L596_026276 [Steinernema carpocapsae]